MKMKAVLFDLGGTLIKSQPVSEVMANILKAHGIERSVEEVERARGLAEKDVDIEEMPVLGDAFWHKWNMQVLEHLGVRNEKVRLAKRISEVWWQYCSVELYPDTQETLRRLRQKGLKIGLVTNGLVSDVREILSRVGLTGLFDVEITSDLVGRMKPSREMFLQALKELSLSPQEVIFVGDHVEYDYRGAKKCGLRTWLVDREGTVGEEDVERIRNLTQLLDYI